MEGEFGGGVGKAQSRGTWSNEYRKRKEWEGTATPRSCCQPLADVEQGPQPKAAERQRHMGTAGSQSQSRTGRKNLHFQSACEEWTAGLNVAGPGRQFGGSCVPALRNHRSCENRKATRKRKARAA